jgi:hypothetical protein
MNQRLTNVHPLRHAALTLAVLFTAAYSTATLGDDIKVKLSGDQEVPPVTTKAAGSGTIVIGADRSVSGGVTTTGIQGTAAHIHVGKAGTNGPVAIPLAQNGDNGWSAAPGAKLSDAQYQSYKAGDLYVNVHSTAHPDGEIRGQLKP